MNYLLFLLTLGLPILGVFWGMHKLALYLAKTEVPFGLTLLYYLLWALLLLIGCFGLWVLLFVLANVPWVG